MQDTLKQGQVWRDIRGSKLGMKCYNRLIDDSDFEIIDVDAYPDSTNQGRRQRTRVRRLSGDRTSCMNTNNICPPNYALIKDANE
jgi:hypothetical protein